MSTSWEKFIGGSQTCMGKIDLTIKGRKYFLNHRENELKDDLKLLSASERKYKNFTLYAQKPGFLTNDVMNLMTARKWKKIKVWSEKFENENQFERFLLSMMESVEDLELRNISLKETTPGYKSEQDFDFNKLKSLSLCNVACTQWLLKSRMKCNQLESLELDNGSNDSLISFIRIVSTVKTLRLTEQTLNDEFFFNLSKVKTLKIKEFKIKTSSSKISESQKGLKLFLEMQADNINKLVIDTSMNFDVMQTIMKFPNLETLNILTKPLYQLNELTINRSIIDLTINFDCSYELILGLISSMAYLKIVKIPTTLYMKLGFPIKDKREYLDLKHLLKVEKF